MLAQMIGGLVLSVATEPSTTAQDRAPVLSRLSECRRMTDDAARLACFDAAAQALDEAESSGEVTVMDRAQVRAARTRLFGLSAAASGLFGRSDNARVEAVETTLASARQQGRGEWVFTLEDGSVWRQIDQESIPTPRRGQPVRIREAAMGSYFLSVNGARSVRARRDQ